MSRTRLNTYRSTPAANIHTRTDLEVIESWSPQARPISCANCLHCKVSGTSTQPVVHCAIGHSNGLEKPLLGVIKEHNPRGFKDASKCREFTSMSDDKE